jgi:hypothetical protein
VSPVIRGTGLLSVRRNAGQTNSTASGNRRSPNIDKPAHRRLLAAPASFNAKTVQQELFLFKEARGDQVRGRDKGEAAIGGRAAIRPPPFEPEFTEH